MNSEKVAVLLSSYNGEKYIEQQIDSILNQKTDCEINLIIRDDGSKDSTVSILERIQSKDKRILVFPDNNIGCNASFFALIKKANELFPQFQYYAFSDQDDVWDKDKLQIGIDAIRRVGRNEPILYGSASRAVTADLIPIPKRRITAKPITFYNSIIQNFIAGHTQVFNWQLLEKVLNADPKRMHGHDSFIVNVAVVSGTVIYDEEPHVSYRQHGDNVLGTANSSRIDWIKERLKRYKKGDVKEYARQIEYIAEYCNSFLSEEEREEIKRFLESRKNIARRVIYIATKKLYRQEAFDDLAFSLLYISGGYNT